MNLSICVDYYIPGDVIIMKCEWLIELWGTNS